MEVCKDQTQALVPHSFQCQDDEDDDDDDNHFVIVLDDKDQDVNELDEFDKSEVIMKDGTQNDNTRVISTEYSVQGTPLSNKHDFLYDKRTEKFVQNSITGGLLDVSMNNESMPPSGLKKALSSSQGTRCTTKPDDDTQKLMQSMSSEFSPSSDPRNEMPTVSGVAHACPTIIKRLEAKLIDHSRQKEIVLSPCDGYTGYKEHSKDSTNKEEHELEMHNKEFVPKDLVISSQLEKEVCQKEEHFPKQSMKENSSNYLVGTPQPTSCVQKGETTFTETVYSFKYHQTSQEISPQPISQRISMGNPNNSYSGPLSDERQKANSPLKTASKVSANAFETDKKQYSLLSQMPVPNQISNSRLNVQRNSCSNEKKNICSNYNSLPVCGPNGNYFLLVIQKESSTINSNATSSTGVSPVVCKPIPQTITDSGRALLLTRDFLLMYKPNLTHLLSGATKVDLSIPDRVHIYMANDNVEKKDVSQNSTSVISPSTCSSILSPTQDCQNSFSSDVRTAGEVLSKIIDSHLKIKASDKISIANYSNNVISCSSVTRPQSRLAKHSVPRILQTGSAFKGSSSTAVSHSQTSSKFSFQNKSLLTASIGSPKITPVQQVPLTSLPPPPPLVRCPTTRPSYKQTSLSCDHVNNDVTNEEPRETLILPTEHRHLDADHSIRDLRFSNISGENIDKHVDLTSDLYTFSAPLDISPENDNCLEGIQYKDGENFKKKTLLVHSTGKTMSKAGGQKDHSGPSLGNTVVVSTAIHDELKCSRTLQPQDTSSHICTPSSSFPSVVTVNLTSSAHYSYPSYILGSSRKNTTMAVDNVASTGSSTSSTSVYSLAVSQHSDRPKKGIRPKQKTCLGEQVVMRIPISSVSESLKSSSLSVPPDVGDMNVTCLPVSPSFQSSSPEAGKQFPLYSPGCSTVSIRSSPCTNSLSKSACVFISSSLPVQATKITSPSITFSSKSSSLVSISSSTLSTSSSPVSVMSSKQVLSSSSNTSVSVDGLKMKIRLKDVSGAQGEGETSSSNTALTESDFSTLTGDNNTPVVKNSSNNRVETAEEMFQRFQEQAKQQVYNAQFGVGDLSRSLRPSRCNISFVDKKLHFSSRDELKKLNGTEAGEPLTTQLSGQENDKDVLRIVVGSKKKKHFSSEGKTDILIKEPRLNINDYPRLRQDNSIIMKKTIHTPNIMAGHQVFVKFNVFSNAQSGRSFLAPFFNLGGRRMQFDYEDMGYIKKAVAEVEKEEKFCARHLMYYTKENNKATFVRKENLTQPKDLNDKSYKKCSYILEGFSRESIKKSAPLPEQWKIDNKVAIEIDRAEVESSVVIDFENHPDDHIDSSVNGALDSPDFSVKDCEDHCIILPHENSLKNNKLEREGNVACKDIPVGDVSSDKVKNSVLTSSCPSPYEKPVCLKHGENDLPHVSKAQSICKTKSSNCKPNILRKTPFLRMISQSQENLHHAPTNEKPSASVPSNYTDQLKELFASGSLQKAVLSDEVCLGRAEKRKENALERNQNSASNIFADIPIKSEIVDEEYEQSYEQSFDNRGNRNSSHNVKIKSEPADEYFQFIERSNSKVSIIPHNAEDVDKSSARTGESFDITNAQIGGEDACKKSDMSSATTMEKGDQGCDINEEDQETLSALSESPMLSSPEKVTSDITSSSSADASEESGVDSEEEEDYEDEESSNLAPTFLQSAPTMSFTSPGFNSTLLSNDPLLPSNPCVTKITSLVESLKQRLIKDSPTLPAVFSKPSKQPKSKIKRKKAKGENGDTSQPLKNCHLRDEIKPLDGTQRSLDAPSPGKSQLSGSADYESGRCNASIDSGEIKSAASIETSGSAHVLDSLSPSCCLSASSPSVTAIDNSSNMSTTSLSNSTTSSVCQAQSHSVLKGQDPDLNWKSIDVECSKITPWSEHAVQLTNETDNAKSLEENVEDKTLAENNGTGHKQSLRNSNQALEKDQVCSKLLPDIEKAADKESSENSPIMDIDCDSDIDIDVGTENVLEIPHPAPCTTKWLLNSPPLSANGRSYLKDFLWENEFISHQGQTSNVSNNQGMQTNIKASNNDDIDSKQVPQKFTLPLRPRTKRNQNKTVAPKVVPTPSVASMLCQKLDITVAPIVPKLKGKLVTPLDSELIVNDGSTKVEVSNSKPLPKPINPAFKPSINAIFGVENIPTSVDSAVKTDTLKMTASRMLSPKGKKGHNKKQVARKGTVKAFKTGANHKQREDEVCDQKNSQEDSKPEIKNFQDNKVQLLTQPVNDSDIDKKKSCLKDNNTSLLCNTNRQRSLRKFALRKVSKARKKDAKREETQCGCKTHSSAGEKFKRTSESIAAFDVKPCRVLLQRLEWDHDGESTMTRSGTYSYMVKDEKVEDEQDISEIIKKRKRKPILNRNKRSRPVRPKKDIVDYYAAAIESLKKKALLLQEEEKKDDAKETSEGRENDSFVSQGDLCLEQKSQAQKEVDPVKLESNLVGKNNDDSLELKLNGDDLTKSASLLEEDRLSNTSEKEIRTDAYIPKTELNEAGPSSVDDTLILDKDAARKCYKRSVSIFERNYEGESIQAYSGFFQDQDNIYEMSDDDMETDSVKKVVCINEGTEQGLESNETMKTKVTNEEEQEEVEDSNCTMMQSNDCRSETNIVRTKESGHEADIVAKQSIIETNVMGTEESGSETDTLVGSIESGNETIIVKTKERGNETDIAGAKESGDEMDLVGIMESGNETNVISTIESRSKACLIETKEINSLKMNGPGAQSKQDVQDVSQNEQDVKEISQSEQGVKDMCSDKPYLDAKRSTAVEKELEDQDAHISHESLMSQDDVEGGKDDPMKGMEHPMKIVSEEDKKSSLPGNSEVKVLPQALGGEVGVSQVLDGSNKTNDKGANSSVILQEEKEAQKAFFHDQEASLEQFLSSEANKFDDYQPSESVNEVADTEKPGSIFNNKDIVLGFEDELGADSVLSKLGPGDDMFLLDDEDDVQNIGLIPDDEVERLLGLDLNNSEDESSEQVGNKVESGSSDHMTSKLIWNTLPETDDGEKDKTEEYQPQKENKNIIHTVQPTQISTAPDVQDEKAETVVSVDVDREMSSKSISCSSLSQNTDSSYHGVSPERNCGNPNSKAVEISPSWKRILGLKALKEIEETVTHAIATAQTKQESVSNETHKEYKKTIVRREKLNLKVCTGALSKALKLSAEMRQNFGSSSSEPKSKKDGDGDKMGVSKSTEQMLQTRMDERTTATLTLCGDKNINEQINRIEKENKGGEHISSQQKTKEQGGDNFSNKQIHQQDEMSSLIVLTNESNSSQSTDVSKVKRTMRKRKMLSNVAQHSEEKDNSKDENLVFKTATASNCISDPSVQNGKAAVNAADKSSDMNSLNDDSILRSKSEASPQTCIKPFGNQKIDLTKLKLKLTPILASEKAKSVIKDAIPKQAERNVPFHIPSFESETKLDHSNTNTQWKADVTGGVPENLMMTEDANPSKNLPLPSALDKSQVKKIDPPVLNTEKLAKILKNFKKPMCLQSELSNCAQSSKHSLSQQSNSSGTVENCSISSQHSKIEKRPSLRKRTRSAQQNTDGKPPKNKRSKTLVTDVKRKGSLRDAEICEKSSELEDKGERSCFDCLSGFTSDAWKVK